MNNIEVNFEQFKRYFKGLEFNKSSLCSKSNSFNFFRSDINVEYEISFAYILNKKEIAINGRINSSITCLEVENILEKFIPLNSFERITVINVPYHEKKIDDSELKVLNTINLLTTKEFEVVRNVINNHILKYILPFFERIPSLHAVNDEILNKVTDDEYTNYIPGQTNFKVLIVMKLCGNPKYEGFKIWALEAYKKGAEMNPERYGSDYKTLQSLVKYLDGELLKS